MIQALAGVILVLLSCNQVLANQDLDSLFDAPCERYGVPKALALAIASHESGMRPWAMNIEGRSVLHASKDEALAISQACLSRGLSFDIGVMQVNSQWLRRYRLPLDVVFDPRGNVQVGVWILAQCIKRHGLTWQAVAAYHTPVERNPDRGRAYAAAVLDRMRRMNAPASTSAQSPVVEQHRPANQAAKTAPLLVKRFREVASNERIVR